MYLLCSYLQLSVVLNIHFRTLMGIFSINHLQHGHLETAPPFTVPCEGLEARFLHCSHRMAVHYTAAAASQLGMNLANRIFIICRLKILIFFQVSKTKLKSDDKRKEAESVGMNIKSVIVVAMMMMLMLFAVHCTWVTSNAYSSPSIVLASYGHDGSVRQPHSVVLKISLFLVKSF